MSDFISLNTYIERLEAERDDLKRQLAQAEHGADLIAGELQTYKARVASLKRQLADDEVKRPRGDVDRDFARNWGLNKGIDNAVDAFVKAAAERDELRLQLAEAMKALEFQRDKATQAQAEVERLRSMLGRGCGVDEKTYTPISIDFFTLLGFHREMVGIAFGLGRAYDPRVSALAEDACALRDKMDDLINAWDNG